MKTLVLLLALVLSSNSYAEVIKITNKDYNSAKSNTQFLKFSMVSWKVGLFKSTFKSYVKDFTVDFDKKNHSVEKAKIDFNVQSMDTDINARNEKMWEFCLDYKNNPNISVEFLDKIDLANTKEQQINATINVRGKKHPVVVTVLSSKVDGHYRVSGNSELSLKELEIPDPSIAVGSVEDKIHVEFNILEN